MCPHCKHELSPLDLVPVLSWLQLKGKCRYCKQPISKQYPLVELLTATLFVYSYIFWPVTLGGLNWIGFAIWLLLLTILVALFVYDQKWMELPNNLVAVATILACLLILIQYVSGVASFSDLVTALMGGALLFGLFYALFYISKEQWIGGGDVKLAPALGLLAGSPLLAMLLLFIASLIGSLIGIPLMLLQKNGSKSGIKLPFGPLLIVGLFVTFFFGQDLVDWYVSNLLYL
jgi:leader peptidase (prepilin peptidase) / N-methyltransferase